MWKEIPGTNGAYMANDETGEIRSTDRYGTDGRRLKGKILIPWKQNSGYDVVTLYVNNISRNYLVHRLIAKTFLEELPGKTDVNHIDGNKSNNKVSNLEYVTRSENIRHCVARNAFSHRVSRYHPVHMLDMEGIYQQSFDSIKEAAEYVGVSTMQIQYALQGKSHSAGGFRWVDDRMFGM